MKLRELEVWEMNQCIAGAPGDGCIGLGIMLCWDENNNSSIKVDLPFFEYEFSLQSYADKIAQHNENQWARGEFIRQRMDDGGEAYGTNIAPNGSIQGYR